MVVLLTGTQLKGELMGFYYVYQHKEKGLTVEKHLVVSDAYPDRESANRARSMHRLNDSGCVFSEIFEASSPEEVLLKVQPERMSHYI